MKNKLKVNIYNRTYNLLSEESQEYTNKTCVGDKFKDKRHDESYPEPFRSGRRSADST